jgi:hypothetical protein
MFLSMATTKSGQTVKKYHDKAVEKVLRKLKEQNALNIGVQDSKQ